MVIKYEGFTEAITEKVKEFITSVLSDNGVSEGTVIIEPVGKAGDNYGADVRRIIADRNGESFRMIAKIKPPTIEALSSFAELTKQVFVNENFMYSTVQPKYMELEKEFDIPEEDRINAAEFYGALLEGDDYIILLEDLQPKKYVMLDRFKGLPEDALKLILKSLASIHAYSFAVRHREPEVFEMWKTYSVNQFQAMAENEEMKMMCVKTESDIIELVNKKYEKYLKGTISKMSDISIKLIKEEENSAYTTMLHGDAWTNNVMFRIEDGKILSCCMIDYQIAKIASPASDLGYMIFNCTDYQSRKDCYHHWIDYYHTQLDKTLNNFGLKANTIYSRDRLDADIRRYAKMTIAITSFTSTFMVRDNEDAVKLKEAMVDFKEMYEATKITNTNSSTVALFKARVEDIVQSHIDLGHV